MNLAVSNGIRYSRWRVPRISLGVMANRLVLWKSSMLALKERTRRVDHFRQIVEVIHHTRILHTIRPELLVSRCPNQKGRMITVALHDFTPFGNEITGRF